MNRVRKAQMAGAGSVAVAFLALATTTVGDFEGRRLVAYRDIVGVPTACYGETRGIRMGMRFTRPECDAMLLKGLSEFADGMERCAPKIAEAPAERYVAHLSLSYNIGLGAYCKSTVVRRFNAGDVRGSCDAFSMWNKAGGREVDGLTTRRSAERLQCLKGI